MIFFDLYDGDIITITDWNQVTDMDDEMIIVA
jgi:hypothetical protein